MSPVFAAEPSVLAAVLPPLLAESYSTTQPAEVIMISETLLYPLSCDVLFRLWPWRALLIGVYLIWLETVY